MTNFVLIQPSTSLIIYFKRFTTMTTNIAEIAAQFVNNTEKNIFLTGKAGTGKTTFLRNIKELTHKNTVIVAPTGIAAINAGGSTIHSLFQLPFGSFVPDISSQQQFTENSKVNTPTSLLKEHKMHEKKRKLIREIELLIIDEVSMLRADLLDAIDTILRHIRRNKLTPFGGVQVLFIGDLLQLPPVVNNQEWSLLKNYYTSPFFFDAQALQTDKPVYIELDKIYRQSDETFINLLNNLRNNTVTQKDSELLNAYFKPDFIPPPNEKYIQLTTHNYKADQLNKTELAKLKDKTYTFSAEITGDFNEYSYPVDKQLELKKGVQVMFIKNDPTGEQRFFNGKIGTISSINSTEIVVEFDDGSDAVELEKFLWQNIRYELNETTNEIEEKVVGIFIQFPVKLAWAITVHKSQGLTFEKAIVDIGDAFAPGQVYVALSRLTSLKGLVLKSPVNFNSLKTDSTIKTYSQSKADVPTLHSMYAQESTLFFKNHVIRSFNFNVLLSHFKSQLESYHAKKKTAKQEYSNWCEAIYLDLLKEKEVTDKFIEQLYKIFDLSNYQDVLQQRVHAASKHFKPIIEQFIKRVKEHHSEIKKKPTPLKTYLKEIEDLEKALQKQRLMMEKSESLVNSLTSEQVIG
jgi:nucleoside-triphosphatase THEP1